MKRFIQRQITQFKSIDNMFYVHRWFGGMHQNEKEKPNGKREVIIKSLKCQRIVARSIPQPHSLEKFK